MHGLTFYQQVGDWPGYGCLLFFAAKSARGVARRRRRFRGLGRAPALS
jgi:apolipoprotein N-acyltransferase